MSKMSVTKTLQTESNPNIMPIDADETLNFYIRKIASYKNLSQEEEALIAKTAKEGTEIEAHKAKQKLVEAKLFFHWRKTDEFFFKTMTAGLRKLLSWNLR